MADIYLYQGEANPPDVVLSDPTTPRYIPPPGEACLRLLIGVGC